MAYEYEKIIKKELEFADLVNADNQDEMLKELEEVYQKAKLLDGVVATTKRRLSKEERKAKAFDKILKIDNQATDEDRITGEYESDIETVLSEYMEDE